MADSGGSSAAINGDEPTAIHHLVSSRTIPHSVSSISFTSTSPVTKSPTTSPNTSPTTSPTTFPMTSRTSPPIEPAQWTEWTQGMVPKICKKKPHPFRGPLPLQKNSTLPLWRTIIFFWGPNITVSHYWSGLRGLVQPIMDKRLILFYF
jgi:hypothetical protein